MLGVVHPRAIIHHTGRQQYAACAERAIAGTHDEVVAVALDRGHLNTLADGTEPLCLARSMRSNEVGTSALPSG